MSSRGNGKKPGEKEKKSGKGTMRSRGCGEGPPAAPDSVLLFDTDTEWARAAAEVLRRFQLKVDVESERFERCFQMAEHTLYSVAVINLSALNDPFEEMLRFCQRFPNIGIVTVLDEPDPTRERWYLGLADVHPASFGSKAHSQLSDLVGLVKRVLQERGLGPEGLDIEWPPNLEEILEKCRLLRDPHAPRDRETNLARTQAELRQVLCRMFAPRGASQAIANKVRLESFGHPAGQSGSVMLKVTPQVVLEHAHHKSALLKFGPKEDIRQEAANYDRFVEWFLKRTQTVRKIADEAIHNYAGILYSFPRDDATGFKSFAAFLREEPVERCLDIVERMFSPDNKQWLGVNGSPYLAAEERFFQSYCFQRVLRCSPSDLVNIHLHRFIQEMERQERRTHQDVWSHSPQQVSIPALNLKLREPVYFLTRHPCVEELVFTVVHGDLHAHNILVDVRESRPPEAPPAYYFIDFKYTGFGHIYQDFIDLELSVRYDLFCSSELPPQRRLTRPDSEAISWKGLKKLIRLEKQLIRTTVGGQTTRDPMLDPDDDRFDAEFHKAFQMISTIRRLAEANSPGRMHLYYLSLVPSALKALKYPYPLDVRLYRYLTAALYADYLAPRIEGGRLLDLPPA